MQVLEGVRDRCGVEGGGGLLDGLLHEAEELAASYEAEQEVEAPLILVRCVQPTDERVVEAGECVALAHDRLAAHGGLLEHARLGHDLERVILARPRVAHHGDVREPSGAEHRRRLQIAQPRRRRHERLPVGRLVEGRGSLHECLVYGTE